MPRRSRAARWSLASTMLSIMLLTQGCGGSGQTIAPTAALPSTAATSAPPATAAPTATSTGTAAPPVDAAPEALQGSWSAVLGPGDVAILDIRATSYKIDRGGIGGLGHISVMGDEITFSRVASCMGEGTYRWSVEDGILTFTKLGPDDPCPRQGMLVGYEYERRGT